MSQSVDDRTEDEKNPKSINYINKSRYSPVYTYLSDNIYIQDFHNDNPRFNIDENSYNEFIKNGIPKRLAEHFCNLMVRDPLVIFDEKIDIEDPDDYSHFENFQSTNWNSLRLKPPKIEDHDFCFKVEVRVPEINISSYENAAMGTFLTLFSLLVYKYDFNTIIPMSKVDENFRKANLNDAVIKEKFWFKTNGLSTESATHLCGALHHCKKENIDDKLKLLKCQETENDNIHLLTVEEIICGSDKYKYPGILWLMEDFVNRHLTSENEKAYIRKHLEFIKLRSNGIIFTFNLITKMQVLYGQTLSILETSF